MPLKKKRKAPEKRQVEVTYEQLDDLVSGLGLLIELREKQLKTPMASPIALKGSIALSKRLWKIYRSFP